MIIFNQNFDWNHNHQPLKSKIQKLKFLSPQSLSHTHTHKHIHLSYTLFLVLSFSMTLKFPGNSFLSIILFQKKPRYTLKATTHSLKLSRIYTHTRTFTHTDTHTHTLFLWFSRGEIEFVWIDDIYMKVYITLCMSSLHQISNYRVWWKILIWFFKNINWFPWWGAKSSTISRAKISRH